MTEKNIKSAKLVIEALLFSTDKPLTLEQLKSALDLQDKDEVRFSIDELKSEYENSNRGIRIAEVAGGFQMITAPVFVHFLRKLYKDRRVERLSKPALETLAIIAYKQPITKTEIVSLRNVNIDGVMEKLIDKNLIRLVGRKKSPGRPFVFGTTRRFLEYFGLRSLDELPKMENFSSFAESKETQDLANQQIITEEENVNKEPAPENR